MEIIEEREKMRGRQYYESRRMRPDLLPLKPVFFPIVTRKTILSPYPCPG